jgi:hypothetical protein
LALSNLLHIDRPFRQIRRLIGMINTAPLQSSMQLWTDQIFGSRVAGLIERASEAGVFTCSGLMPTAIARLQDRARAVGDYRQGVCQLPSALCALRPRFPRIATSAFSRDLLDKITLPEYSGPCPYGGKRSRCLQLRFRPESGAQGGRLCIGQEFRPPKWPTRLHLRIHDRGYTTAHVKARNLMKALDTTR